MSAPRVHVGFLVTARLLAFVTARLLAFVTARLLAFVTASLLAFVTASLLAFVTASLLLAATASARIKVDRYVPGTLPEFELWVTLLDEPTRPLGPDDVQGFALFVDGEKLSTEVDFETSHERGEPMAIGVVLDARFASTWDREVAALEELFSKRTITEDSVAFAMAVHDGVQRVPEEADRFSKNPRELPASLRDVEIGGSEPHLHEAIRAALRSFPLAPGLEPEPDDGPLPKRLGPQDDPFPIDRVLYVLGDGAFEAPGAGKSSTDQVRELMHLAERRGVRFMGIGVSTEITETMWTLRVLSRKSGGTYRRAEDQDLIVPTAQEAAAELAHRFVLTAENDGLEPGDLVSFMVHTQTRQGQNEETRDFEAVIGHRMGFFARAFDALSDKWERAASWVRFLILFIVALIVVVIALFIIVRRVRRRRSQAAAAAARTKLLATRRPCPVCSQLMMPDWKTCLFCQKPVDKPMRFRLTGRAGAFAGTALRFDKDMVTLGSGSHCDVCIAERRVQAEHAGLRDRGTEFILTDFNTEGGTWVNGERIAQVQLYEGDVVRIGETELLFAVEAQA